MLVANVDVDFSLEPEYVSFGRITAGEIKDNERIVKVIGDDCTKFTITKVVPKEAGIVAKILPPEKEGEGQRISVTLSKDVPVGNFRSALEVHSTHPKYPMNLIQVSAIIMGHIQTQPERVYFRVVPNVETEERIITVFSADKSSNFKILSMNIEPEPIPNSTARQKSVITYLEATKDDLEMKMLEPDAEGKQRISLKLKRKFNPGERVQGKIVLKTDDKSQDSVNIYYHIFSELPRKNTSQ